MYSAGRLDQMVMLQRRQAGVDALGQPSENWQTVATCRAAVEPLRGREYFAAAQMQSEAQVRVTIRWRSGVDGTLRVLWRGQAHDIVSVIEPRAGRETLELMCSAGVRDGR